MPVFTDEDHCEESRSLHFEADAIIVNNLGQNAVSSKIFDKKVVFSTDDYYFLEASNNSIHDFD